MKILVLILPVLLLANNTNAYDSDDPSFGELEFERSCSVCHGFQGRGNGVLANELTESPADLTQLTKNNHGHFPFTEVYRVIEGSRRVGVHGSRDMPIWGDRYRKEAERYNADRYLYTRGLILELMFYIMSIQEK